MKQKRKAPRVPGVENEDSQPQFEGEDDGEVPLLRYSLREEDAKVAKVAEKEER